MSTWAGRVEGSLDHEVWAFLRSDDAELLPYDCEATLFHAQRLAEAGILGAEELAEVEARLAEIAQGAGPGEDGYLETDEDVHSAIERLLGDVGRKIHAGRSRNDQVVAAMRLYVLDACAEAREAIDALALVCLSFAESEAEVGEGGLRLIHKRDAWMHNSWFANVERMKRNGRTTNPVSLHPDDAARLGASDGQEVTVTSDHGQVSTVVEIDDALMPGVVSMVHGWGHSVSPGLRVAHRHPGANPNQLLPIGEGSFEPLSSQAHMTGIPVEIRLLA